MKGDFFWCLHLKKPIYFLPISFLWFVVTAIPLPSKPEKTNWQTPTEKERNKPNLNQSKTSKPQPPAEPLFHSKTAPLLGLEDRQKTAFHTWVRKRSERRGFIRAQLGRFWFFFAAKILYYSVGAKCKLVVFCKGTCKHLCLRPLTALEKFISEQWSQQSTALDRCLPPLGSDVTRNTDGKHRAGCTACLF